MFLIKIVLQYNASTYPVFPITPAGKFPPASRLCSVCRSWTAGFGCYFRSSRTAAMVRVFGGVGHLKRVDRILYPTAPFSRNVGFKNPTYAADNVLIGRLKMTSQISWLLHYFQTASSPFKPRRTHYLAACHPRVSG